MGGQNSDLHRNWWSKSVQDSHCFCYWRLKTVVQCLRWPQKLLFWARDSYQLPSWVAKILICIEICGPNQCRILIVFATGGLKLSFNAAGGHKNCYSERRILISCRHGCPKFWFASKTGGQTRVLTWSFRCTTYCFGKWRPKSVVQSLRWPHTLPFWAKDSQ